MVVTDGRFVYTAGSLILDLAVRAPFAPKCSLRARRVRAIDLSAENAPLLSCVCTRSMPFLNYMGRRPPRTRRPSSLPQCTCPIPAGPISRFQPNIFRAGNMNMPGSLASGPRRHASAVYAATWWGKPPGKTIYYDQKINVFGQREGAPNGSNRRPQNQLLK